MVILHWFGSSRGWIRNLLGFSGWLFFWCTFLADSDFNNDRFIPLLGDFLTDLDTIADFYTNNAGSGSNTFHFHLDSSLYTYPILHHLYFHPISHQPTWTPPDQSNTKTDRIANSPYPYKFACDNPRTSTDKFYPLSPADSSTYIPVIFLN